MTSFARFIVPAFAAVFTCGPAAAAVGSTATHAGTCDALSTEYVKASDRWDGLTPEEQRRFPSLLSMLVEREAAYRECVGLPPNEETLADRWKAVKG